jgi:hypothetical protein
VRLENSVSSLQMPPYKSNDRYHTKTSPGNRSVHISKVQHSLLKITNNI